MKKIFKGIKGVVIGLVKTALPNIKENIASEIGGEGKLHIPSAVTSWIYAAIALASTAWVIYSLVQGKDPATIKEEVDLINGN